MFKFGDTIDPNCDMMISNLDQVKLQGAPINNLVAERSVGSTNYELKIRGNKQLKAASSAHVKGKVANMMNGQEMDKCFVKLVSKKGVLPAIMQKWEEKQKELKKDGLEAKEVGNISVYKQRNADLASSLS